MAPDRYAAPAPGRRERSEFIVVKELDPLRDSSRGRIVVRILQVDRGRRLDIREYVDEERYQGFTKRGVNLSSEEVNALFAQRGEIVRWLEGGA
jgi:hypothetical protein